MNIPFYYHLQYLQEHDAFLLGLGLYGRDWKKVATAIKTRTASQIRSHAQKYFQKLSRTPILHEGHRTSVDEEDKDAFAVLEYLESTLTSLKRRRDELDGPLINPNNISYLSLANCRESDNRGAFHGMSDPSHYSSIQVNNGRIDQGQSNTNTYLNYPASQESNNFLYSQKEYFDQSAIFRMKRKYNEQC